MSTWQHWKTETDAQGIHWWRIDVADKGANVLGRAVIEELEQLVVAASHEPPTGIVITSAKDSGFIAGADVHEFTRIEDEDQALELIRRGQGLMDRIEALPCPVVALINGFCLGGGLELALACDWRIALDDPKTRIGLPEVKLGIHPGFGGSVRSIETIGVLPAMNLMLAGSTVDARKARRLGLVDDCVPDRQLESAARHFLTRRPPRHRPAWHQRLLDTAPMRPLVARLLQRAVARKAPRDHYPAPWALIDLWLRHGGNRRAMLEAEARSVARLITGETARNLVRVFMLQDRLKSQGRKQSFRPAHVHVVGAGVMGGDIAAWSAINGFRTSVEDTRAEALGSTVGRASTLCRRRFRRYPHLGTAALDRLLPDIESAGRAHAGLVIEAIVEQLDAKRELFKALEQAVPDDCLLATNTSSIPLEEIGEGLENPQRLVGLHFFNPVAKMPLVEIVRGTHTGAEAMERAAAWARAIGKLPLPVRSSPGFLVNRILMPYLLEAILMVEEGIPAVVIDRCATRFGMPMGPLELADTVGLDICLHVGRNLAEHLPQDPPLAVPAHLQRLVEQGHLGKKSGQGFYRWPRGKIQRPKAPPGAWDQNRITDRMILRLLNEAAACLAEGVVEDTDLLDAGMVFGTGFAPFRGGPMHYARSLGFEEVAKRLDALAEDIGPR
ncbi:MAG: hypothetical protein D6717_12455, partial [Gammaproteobacteria bacterium]